MNNNSLIICHDKDKGKKVIIENQRSEDRIKIHYTETGTSHKKNIRENTIVCIKDAFLNQEKELHNETFLYPHKEIPEHLLGVIPNIADLIASLDHLPYHKKEIIKQLQSQFPVFMSHNLLRPVELETYQHGLLKKQQKTYLLANEVESLSHSYDQNYQTLKQQEGSISTKKRIIKLQNKLQGAKDSFDDSTNKTIESFVNQYRMTQKEKLLLLEEKKRLDLTLSPQHASSEMEIDIDEKIEDNNKLLEVYQQQIASYYDLYKTKVEKPLSQEEFIKGYNGEFHTLEMKNIVKKGNSHEKKYANQQEKGMDILQMIYSSLEAIESLSHHWLLADSQDISYAYRYLEQDKLRDPLKRVSTSTERVSKKRKGITSEEQLYERAWESLKDTYNIMRAKTSYMKDLAHETGYKLGDIDQDLIITKQNSDNLQFLSADYNRLKGEVVFDNSPLLKEKYTEAQREYENYYKYLIVMRELMYQYRMYISQNNKEKKNNLEERLHHNHQFVFSLPHAIKKAGLRKFDSMYVDFAQWMKKKNTVLGEISPIQHLQDHGDRDTIVELIEQLPIYKHNR